MAEHRSEAVPFLKASDFSCKQDLTDLATHGLLIYFDMLTWGDHVFTKVGPYDFRNHGIVSGIGQ